MMWRKTNNLYIIVHNKRNSSKTHEARSASSVHGEDVFGSHSRNSRKTTRRYFAIKSRRFIKMTSAGLFLLSLLWIGISFWSSNINLDANQANALTAVNPSTIPACGGNPECFAFTVDTRMTDTLDTASNHFSGTARTFAVPTTGFVNNTYNHAYKWIINWGDGSAAQAVTGTGSGTSAGISHTYATAGRYRITIRPNVTTPAAGWMNAFSFNGVTTAGANAVANRQMFYSIDTPLTNLMRTKGAPYRFRHMFYGAINAIGIPDNLLTNISTTGDTSLDQMFNGMFASYAYNSTTATIPAGLFSSLNTTSATNFGRMFVGTFNAFARQSASGNIPAGLFSSVNTANGTSFIQMFSTTFIDYSYNSTVGTIPSGLFNSINTSKGTDFTQMFNNTFYNYATNSAVGIIPASLFSAINTSKGTTFTNMFNLTFSNYAKRTATFRRGNTVTATQTFADPYSTKNQTTGAAPSTNPTVAAGNKVVPTYNNTTRSITNPGGTWYRTDGTSCSVASPTVNCGAQTSAVTFPVTNEWINTTSTEKGNVTFYAPVPTISNVVTATGAGVTADYTVKANGEWPNATIGTARTTRTVAITGTNLTGATAVTVGGTACASYSVTNAAAITCTLSTTTKSGNQVVVVTTPSGSTTAVVTAGTNAITYVAAPTVSSTNVANVKTNGQAPDTLSGTTWTAATATTSTITGTNLNGGGFATTATVTMGGAACTSPTISSATTMTCIRPNWGSAGAKTVQVTNAYGASGTATSVNAIAAPTISSISPNSNLPIAGGANITLTGTSFQSTFTTTVGGTNCNAKTYTSATASTCTIPAKGAGSTNAVVTRTPYGTSGSVNVIYRAAPTVTAVSPSTGPLNTAGRVVTITGTNFTNASSVTVGGTVCTTFSVINATTISCTLPSFATAGTKSILVTTSGGTNTANSLYNAMAAPTVTSISPSSGPVAGGTNVTIAGTNFVAGAGLTIGNITCTNIAVVSSTRITCTTPAHSVGTVSVAVTTPGGSSTTSGNALYAYSPPSIASVTPTSGSPLAGGGTLTIIGSNFQGATSVTVGGNVCTNHSINSTGTQITCIIPASSTPGAKAVTVAVGGYGSGTKSGAYTYISFIQLSLSSNTINIPLTPTATGAFASSSHVVSVKTDNPTGYNLTLSTNLPSTNPNAINLKHTTQNQYINGTTNTCNWNNTTKVLIGTNNPLSNNTWGFTLIPANASASSQRLCQVPSSSSPLTIKSTTSSNQTAPGDQTTIYYGARVELSKPAGTYKTTVVVTAGTNL